MLTTTKQITYNGSSSIDNKTVVTIESANDRKQGEIKALEMKHEGVPMPEKYKERLEDMRNGDS